MNVALVIDDNRLMADGLCDMLRLLGLEAYPVYGSRSAILALGRKMPDVIFLDINMPGVSGFEVMSYIKREPRLEKIPIIVITSDDQAQTADKARKTGALLTIIKPPTLAVLENTLHKIGLLNRRR